MLAGRLKTQQEMFGPLEKRKKKRLEMNLMQQQKKQTQVRQKQGLFQVVGDVKSAKIQQLQLLSAQTRLKRGDKKEKLETLIRLKQENGEKKKNYIRSSVLTRIDTDEIDADSDSITGDEGVGVKSIELPDEEETCSCSSDGGLADCMLDETAFVLEVAKISAKNEL